MKETKVLPNGLMLIDKHITTEPKRFNDPDTVYLLGEAEEATVWMVRPQLQANWYWTFSFLRMYCRKDGSYSNNPKIAYETESQSLFNFDWFEKSNYIMPSSSIRLKSISVENVIGLYRLLSRTKRLRDLSFDFYGRDERNFINFSLITLPSLFALTERIFAKKDKSLLWTVQDFQKHFLMNYDKTKHNFKDNHIEGIFLFNKESWNEEMLTDIPYSMAYDASETDSTNVKRFNTVQELNSSELSNYLNDWIIKVL